jgi:hypothetical protein
MCQYPRQSKLILVNNLSHATCRIFKLVSKRLLLLYIYIYIIHCYTLGEKLKKKKPMLSIVETKMRERSKEPICSCLLSLSLFTLRSYTSSPILVFFYFFICRCFPTRSSILASLLCIRPSTSVLCSSSPP